MICRWTNLRNHDLFNHDHLNGGLVADILNHRHDELNVPMKQYQLPQRRYGLNYTTSGSH